jgi:molybdenum cofactor synthesis domain-containing protein
MFTYGILTSSDSGALGDRQDTSGQLVYSLLNNANFKFEVYEVVPDEQDVLEDRLRTWADEYLLDLIITTGSTGLARRDVIPEATLAVIQREVPGMAEAMRTQTLIQTPMAMISRSVVGVRGNTLIINLPGSPLAVQQCLDVVLPVLFHAIEVLQKCVVTHDSWD